jgi:hypothetical protein
MSHADRRNDLTTVADIVFQCNHKVGDPRLIIGKFPANSRHSEALPELGQTHSTSIESWPPMQVTLGWGIHVSLCLTYE